jgi:hypothetical protein
VLDLEVLVLLYINSDIFSVSIYPIVTCYSIYPIVTCNDCNVNTLTEDIRLKLVTGL